MTEEVEQDGGITLHPKSGQLVSPRTRLLEEKQEIWETKEFILGVDRAVRGYPRDDNTKDFCLWYQVEEDSHRRYIKGWNFGNAIINPILARIEMEKD